MKRRTKKTARNLFPIEGVGKEAKKSYQAWRTWLVSFLNENIPTLRHQDFLKVFREFVEKFYGFLVEPDVIPSLCADTERNRVSLTLAQVKIKAVLVTLHRMREESLRTGEVRELRLFELLPAITGEPSIVCYDPRTRAPIAHTLRRRNDRILFDKGSVIVQPLFYVSSFDQDACDRIKSPRYAKIAYKAVKEFQLKEEIYKALPLEVIAQEQTATELQRRYLKPPGKDAAYHVKRLLNMYGDLSENKREMPPDQRTNELEPDGHRRQDVIAKEAEERAFKNVLLQVEGAFVPFETWYDEHMDITLCRTIVPLFEHIPLASIRRCARCLTYFECDPGKKKTPFCEKHTNRVALYSWREKNRPERNRQEMTRGIGADGLYGSIPMAKIKEILEKEKNQG